MISTPYHLFLTSIGYSCYYGMLYLTYILTAILVSFIKGGSQWLFVHSPQLLNYLLVKQDLISLLDDLIMTHHVDNFYVGNEGLFDALVHWVLSDLILH